MNPTSRPQPRSPAFDHSRRVFVLAASLWASLGSAEAQAQAQAQPQPPGAPRLKFRTRRAVCECSGDTDEEAIEQAAERLRSKEPAKRSDGTRATPDKTEAPRSPSDKSANDGASQTDGKPEQDKPTTRRQTP
jgi:hypothetical protein